MSVVFVRVLRLKEMKFGIAVDEHGNVWKGFFAKTTSDDIYRTAILGDVGLCFKCRDRVFEGWNCESTKEDLCNRCVRIADLNKVFVIGKDRSQNWDQLQQRFLSLPDFDPNK